MSPLGNTKHLILELKGREDCCWCPVLHFDSPSAVASYGWAAEMVRRSQAELCHSQKNSKSSFQIEWCFRSYSFSVIVQIQRKHQRYMPTLRICSSDKVSASLSLEFSHNIILAEMIKQGSVLSFWQQGWSDGWPQLSQLDTVGCVKVLQGKCGGRALGTSGSLCKERMNELHILTYLFSCLLWSQEAVK